MMHAGFLNEFLIAEISVHHCGEYENTSVIRETISTPETSVSFYHTARCDIAADSYIDKYSSCRGKKYDGIKFVFG
jgi:hypothetical protein